MVLTRARSTAVVVVAVAVATAAFWIQGRAAVRPVQVREVAVVGDQFAFSPARVEVQKDDLVQIKFTSQDIAHSFVIDAPYRISKRAGAGQTVVFEFRADEIGRFRFYCNLTQDERCRKMAGELVVR